MLDPAKLRAVPGAELFRLVDRAAASRARLLELEGAAERADLRSLLLLLTDAVLEIERELRRRDEQTQLAAAFLDELDPAQVHDAA